MDRFGGFDPTLWRAHEKAGAATKLRHVLRRLKERKELDYNPQNKLIYITGKSTVPIQIRVYKKETMNRAKAEAEIENLSKSVRPKEKTDGKRDGQNRERSRSKDASDKKNSRDKSRGRSSSQSTDKKMTSRDRSKSATRDRSESASKERGRAGVGKATTKSENKTGGERKVEEKKKSGPTKFIWTAASEEDPFSEGELIEKGANKENDSTESEDNDVINLGRKLHNLSTKETHWKNKREREDSSSSDSPPRKAKTPEPKLSDIDEVMRTKDFWAEENSPGYMTEEERIMEENQIMKEHIDYVRGLERDVQARDKEILTLVTKLRKTEDWYDGIIKERDSELEKLAEAEKEGKKNSMKQETALNEKETEAAKLQMELSEKEEECAKIKEELEEEKTKGMKSSVKIAEMMEMKAELEKTMDDLGKAQKSTMKLMAELEETQAQLEKAREGLAEEKGRSAWTSSKLTRAEEQLEVEKKRSEEAEIVVIKYQKRCQTLEEKLQEQQEQDSKAPSLDMEKRLKDHEAQIQTLMSEVKALKSVNEGLEGRMTGTFRQLRSIRPSRQTSEILAVDGDASDESDQNSDNSDSDNELEDSPSTEERELSEREVKAMIDSYLVWPTYEDTFSHKDFVQKCRRAAERGISRGIPKEKVATNLNVHVERKVQQIKQKFEALREEDDRDKSLEETLDMIERCGPDEHPSEQYGNMAQATKEITTSYMNRVEKTHDDNFKTTSEEDRIHSIKKQFFKGLRNKPQGIEMALAGLMDLDKVAKTTQRMQEEEKKERKKQAAVDQVKEKLKRRESPPLPAQDRHYRRDRYRQIATVSAEDCETSVEGSKTTERAATGEEFKKDATVCRNCRMTDAHYTRQCQNASYCSVCKSEGHTDEQHGSERNSEFAGGQGQQQRSQGQGFRGYARGQRGGNRGYGGRSGGSWNNQGYGRWNNRGNSQWSGQGNGQWSGQGNGQWNGQWSGQGNGQWNGQGNGQWNGQANNQWTTSNGQWNNQGNGQWNNQGGNQRGGQSFGQYRGSARHNQTETDKPSEANNQANGTGNGNQNSA